MRAVLLFSAVLHIAAVGALAAFALRAWLNARRPKEPSVADTVVAAAALGGCVAVAGTIVMWLGRGFGTSLTAGLAAGLLSALAFLLALGALPHARAGFGEPPSVHVRLSAAGLVAALVLTEVIAFCFLVATAGTTAPYS